MFMDEERSAEMASFQYKHNHHLVRKYRKGASVVIISTENTVKRNL
jgi:hypothetical protein